MKSCDIAIIGGGPAGLACAIELSLKGLVVTLIEPEAWPIDKPCGEGIMPEGVMHLQRLGVMPHLNKNHLSPFLGICLINARGVRAISKFAKGPGLGCRRTALSSALYARALELPTISFLRAKARGIEKTPQAMIIRTTQESIKARLVIGADGLRSPTRRWASLAGRQRCARRYGLRQHYRVKPWNNYVEVYFKSGLEAYITPSGPEQTNVTFLWSKDEIAKERIEKMSFKNLIKLFPAIEEKIKSAEPLSQERAIGPLEQRCISPISDGVALVGDASGYLDAITGEGNSLAMSQAQALASVIANIGRPLTKPVLSLQDLSPYRDAHASIVRSYYRNTRLMLNLALNPRLMDVFIECAALSPSVFSWFINAIRGYRFDYGHA